jgi:hypothetical protein
VQNLPPRVLGKWNGRTFTWYRGMEGNRQNVVSGPSLISSSAMISWLPDRTFDAKSCCSWSLHRPCTTLENPPKTKCWWSPTQSMKILFRLDLHNSPTIMNLWSFLPFSNGSAWYFLEKTEKGITNKE